MTAQTAEAILIRYNALRNRTQDRYQRNEQAPQPVNIYSTCRSENLQVGWNDKSNPVRISAIGFQNDGVSNFVAGRIADQCLPGS